jgi:hypothetical protein
MHRLTNFYGHHVPFSHKQGSDPRTRNGGRVFKHVFDPFFTLFILVACRRHWRWLMKLLRLIACIRAGLSGWAFLKRRSELLFPMLSFL